VEAANRIGYPVVLKIHSERVIHKSDAGGVHLDLRDAARVRDAFRALGRLVADGRLEARLTPFMPGGIEVILGARRDPQYGPIALFGAGGTLTEIARDRSIRSLPCPGVELEEMIAQTRAGRLLDGVRKEAPADRRAVVRALTGVTRLLLSVPEVQDVEVNPLRCTAEGVVALDTRVLGGT
jgi:acetyltransferase